MSDTFLATLWPMLTLFICIAVGFIAKKTKVLPDNAGKVMAKLETWIFCPALSFTTMSTHCTVDSLKTHGINVILSSVAVSVALLIAIPLAMLFVRKKIPERGVYMYALAFANNGYVGDPLVQDIFGAEALSYYKLFCLPIAILVYTWGIGVLVPKGEGKSGFFKRLLNAPTIAMLIGMIFGISGLGANMPTFLSGALSKLAACMGPVAMLLAGFTVAKYGFVSMLKNKKIYLATFLRLFILPTIIISTVFGFKELLNLIFNIHIDNAALYLCFFATAAPLGLNTVVFPEAYGGNSETGASMAMISHTLCVISIPIMYALMQLVFGTPALPVG